MDATQAGDIEEVKKLLKEGVDVNQKGEGLAVALHSAALTGRTEIASLLLDHGANIEARSKTQETPLHLAAAYLEETLS
jgi:ankyrin repeat protein